MHTKFCLEELKGRDYIEDLDTDGRLKLEWMERCGLVSCDSG